MKFKTLKILAATAVLAGSMQTVSAKVKTVEKFTTVTESATIVAIDSFDPDASWMKVEEITVAE